MVLEPINSKLFSKESKYLVKKTVDYFLKPPKSASKALRAAYPKDRRWDYMIPCRKGGKISGVRAHIYSVAVGRLAYCGVGMRLRNKLLALDGVCSYQTGDQEFSVVFPDTALPAVALVVGARRRRTQKTGLIGTLTSPNLLSEAPNKERYVLLPVGSV